VTTHSAAINLDQAMTRRPNHTADWNQQLLREHVLHLRHRRWRTNSLHILRLARKLLVAWLLLRHGTDLTDTLITVTGTP
jgi:hypothetical protein